MRKRIKLNQAGFRALALARAFAEFGEWLLAKVGEHKAAITIHRYLPFFIEIDKQWGNVPDYETLLEHFHAEGLRRVRLPMKWLAENRSVSVDARSREDHSNRRRMEEMLTTAQCGSEMIAVLREYRAILVARVEQGSSTLNSARLALRPAVSLINQVDPTSDDPPTQTTIDTYLRRTPGQRAALTGFINFLNARCELNLVSEAVGQTKRMRRARLEKALIALVNVQGTGAEFVRKWLSVALAFFHSLPRVAGKKSTWEAAVGVGGKSGFLAKWHDREYWVPHWVWFQPGVGYHDTAITPEANNKSDHP